MLHFSVSNTYCYYYYYYHHHHHHFDSSYSLAPADQAEPRTPADVAVSSLADYHSHHNYPMCVVLHLLSAVSDISVFLLKKLPRALWLREELRIEGLRVQGFRS